jgi:hypothetical protein
MSWLNFFETKTEVKHSFGRGINANLSEDEEELFNKSYEAFEKKDIINAYFYFFKSLENFSNKTSNNNIIINKQNQKLSFEIFQGTARISGYVTKEYIYADSILTKKSSKNVALKRYLLERNYQLTYASYFSDDEYIKLKLFHDNITMTPQKIFYPLMEIALNADFDKEYTKCEFSDVIIEDIGHLKPIDKNELEIKYNYLNMWIDDMIYKISTYPSNDNAAMQSFTLLYILLKIDYLIVPKYDMYQQISKIVQEYFSNENSTVEAKNEELENYILQLRDMPFEEFSKNFYDAKYTFNPSETADNLKKSGAFVPGIRPGEQTARYIDTIMGRLTLIGAIYITAVCLVPEFLILKFNTPFYFGGTSLLIIVVVTMDFLTQVQSQMMSYQYDGLLKKANFKAR